MSLTSWKEEFYPIDAAHPDALKAPAAHSLQKWLGLRPEALARHKVYLAIDEVSEKGRVVSRNGSGMYVDSYHCALCERYLKRLPMNTCSRCPLYKLLNHVSCDEGDDSPYDCLVEHKDPEPMIAALTELARRESKS